MGIRLHAITQKEKYGNNSFFNNQIEQVNRLFIMEFGAVPDSDMSWEYSGRITIQVKQLKKVIDDIINDKDGKVNGIRNKIDGYINVESHVEFADMLFGLMQEADKSNDEIQLCWF